MADIKEPTLISGVTYAEEYSDLITSFKEKAPAYENFQDTDVISIFFQIVAALLVDVYAKLNAAVKTTLILLATGDWLDQLGATWNITRKVLVEQDLTTVPATVEVLETDDAYRARILAAIAAFNKGATIEYYEYYALQASDEVASVKVYKEKVNTPYVNVAIRSTEGNGDPSEELISTVSDYLNSKSVRSVSDIIKVRSAASTTLDIEAEITLLEDAASTAIQDITDYFTQEFNKINGLGRDITTSWIISKLNTSDVYKVNLIAPTEDVLVDNYQFVALGDITLTEIDSRNY